LGWCIRGFGKAYYRDWDVVLDGLLEAITEIGLMYYMVWRSLLQGLGWCIKGFGDPITEIGMVY
jgi:hypothetical protein